MKQTAHTPSLRRQMTLIILLCWLLPMVFGTVTVGYYVLSGVGQQREASLAQQFQLTLQMGEDRVNSAVEASRLPSYDPELREAWTQYKRGGSYPNLYRRYSTLFSRLYQIDSRFDYAIFSFANEWETRRAIAVVSNSTGAGVANATRVWDYWERDREAVWETAKGLDAAVGFVSAGEQIYLVRNLLDSSYQPIGVLALALNQDYYFGDLALLNWASSVSVQLGDGVLLNVRGEEPPKPGPHTLESALHNRDYTLRGMAEIDQSALRLGTESYFWMLLILGCSLLLLLIFTFRFFRQKISKPVQTLMEGAERIRQGEIGSQIDQRSGSREFQFLTDSFNQMSGQLRQQFDQLYQEELARRDAEIKALQAHINPHFLNNTLEIINWEARMNGDAKVSKMIEALATVMDAALDRRGKPQVRLAEEMTYVNAYLYIVAQRFGKRVTVNIDLPEELMDYQVPRLILQPVIENAVEHGVGVNGQGRVNLRGYRREDKLILEIENDGGMTAQDEEHIARLLSLDHDMHSESSGNIGIANVNLRLRILYGEDCGLTITKGEGTLVVARLTIAAQQ